MNKLIKVKIGDSRKLIHTLTDKSIDCCVTSPPYWGLRNYKTELIIFDGLPDCNHEWGNKLSVNRGHPGNMTTLVGTQTANLSKSIEDNGAFCSLCGAWKGQLGLEPTPELYIKHLLDFFDDVKLKLKNEGNCFVNLADTFWGGGNASGHTEDTVQFGVSKTLEHGYNNNPVARGKHPQLKPKSLCLIPSRFAWGMIERNWILRNEIIFYKPNHMPESMSDRLTKSHEVIYHFVQQGKYYYNLDAIREPFSESTIQRITQQTVFDQTGGVKQDTLRGIPENGNASRCNKMVQSLATKYQGKFEGNENPECFGSPRARTQRNRANTGDNNKEPYKKNNPHTMRLRDKHSNNSCRTTSCLHDGRNPLDVHHPLGKNPGDVWSINTQPYSDWTESFNGCDYVGADGTPYKASIDCSVHAGLCYLLSQKKELYDELLNLLLNHKFDIDDHPVLKQFFSSFSNFLMSNDMNSSTNVQKQKTENTGENKKIVSLTSFDDLTTSCHISSRTNYTQVQRVLHDDNLSYLYLEDSGVAIQNNNQNHKRSPVLYSNFPYISYDKTLYDILRIQEELERIGLAAHTDENNILAVWFLNVLCLSAQTPFHIVDRRTYTNKCACTINSLSHFATFPLELVKRPILAGCPVGGTVLDPFAGSGTVGEFCRHNDRNAILFELNPEYKKLIENRAMLLVPELSQFFE